ncbi:MAG: hypothetical protein CL534_11375 [Ahrensia sp.]|nr:hypothetical protein [Ahrensia sp.]
MKDELQALIDRASEALDKAESANLADAVFVAAQTHRLDFISLVLTAITIILAFGGLFAFFEIRYRAKIAAQDTARSECRSIAAELLKNYANDELPDEVRRLVELIMQEKDGDGNGGDYGQQDTGQVQS